MGGPSGKSKHKKAVRRILTDKRKRQRAKHKEGAHCYVSKKTGRLKKMKRRDYQVPDDGGESAVVSELLHGPAPAPPVTIEADLGPSTSSKAARLNAMQAKRAATAGAMTTSGKSG